MLWKYKTYIHQGSPIQMPNITAGIVMGAFRSGFMIAGGMDWWQPSELALFSLILCGRLAEQYTLIEQGGPSNDVSSIVSVGVNIPKVLHYSLRNNSNHKSIFNAMDKFVRLNIIIICFKQTHLKNNHTHLTQVSHARV